MTAPRPGSTDRKDDTRMSRDGAFAHRWILAFAGLIAEHEAMLNDLDQAAGDGDFGTNIAAGTSRYRARTANAAPAGDGGAFHVLADTFLDEIGGTSGPLFGLLFLHLAGADGTAADTVDAAALAERVTAGLAAIQRVGAAEPGDKTLVDALAPARDALRANTGSGVREAVTAAAGAAETAAAATRKIRARRGRASYVGDHAIGVTDPGAQAVAYLFQAAATAATTVTNGE